MAFVRTRRCFQAYTGPGPPYTIISQTARRIGIEGSVNGLETVRLPSTSQDERQNDSVQAYEESIGVRIFCCSNLLFCMYVYLASRDSLM